MSGSRGRRDRSDPAAAAGVPESAIEPVLPGRRGLRQQAGIIAVATVAITVLLAGLGLGELGTKPVPSPPGPSPAPSGAVSPGSPPPASEAPTPHPTALPGLACFPASPASPPELGLGAVDRASEPTAGLAGPAGWELSSQGTAAWPVPNGLRKLILDAPSALEVTAAGGICIRHIVAEYLAVADLGRTPTALGPGAWSINPPAASVDLVTLPAGDWVVRVEAAFATGTAAGDRAVTERFFRVITGLGPGESPIVTPAVACVPLPPDAPLPQLALLVGEGAPVTGADPDAVGENIPGEMRVAATFPTRLELQVLGDACATSWRFTYASPADGSILNEFVQENPDDNPFLVSQNRIELQSVTLGRSVMRADVYFGRARWVSAVWELTLDGPTAPAARVLGASGNSAVALPGCGVGWTLPSGQSAWEACQRTVVPDRIELLAVDSGTTVRLEVPGWRITGWWITCGERSQIDGTYLEFGDCLLGGWGDGSAAVGPARFVPQPGRHVVLAWISATRNGISVNVPYLFEVDTRP